MEIPMTTKATREWLRDCKDFKSRMLKVVTIFDGYPRSFRWRCWLETSSLPGHISYKDVRSVLAALDRSQHYSLQEVFSLRNGANQYVETIAYLIEDRKGTDHLNAVQSIFKAIDLVREIRTCVPSLRVFAETMPEDPSFFGDRDWRFFDAHEGRVFDEGSRSIILKLISFSKDDIAVYEETEKILENNWGQVTANSSLESTSSLINALGGALMRLRGHRKDLLDRLHRYFGNLKRYADAYGGGRASREYVEAVNALRSFSAIVPDNNNEQMLQAQMKRILSIANRAGHRVYGVRRRMVGSAAIVRLDGLPRPVNGYCADALNKVGVGLSATEAQAFIKAIVKCGIESVRDNFRRSSPEAVLKGIRDCGSQMETAPASYQSMQEPDLRNVLLVALNTRLEGGVTGETFRNKGKVDVFVPLEDGCAFVAECKIWSGEAGVVDALEQLDGYLLWKDGMAALIFFVRRTDFRSVCEKMKKCLEKIPSVSGVQSVKRNELIFYYRSKSSGGARKKVRAFLFDLHVSADK